MYILNTKQLSLHLPCYSSRSGKHMIYLNTMTLRPIMEINSHRIHSRTTPVQPTFLENICYQLSVFTFWQPWQMCSQTAHLCGVGRLEVRKLVWAESGERAYCITRRCSRKCKLAPQHFFFLPALLMPYSEQICLHCPE